MMWCIDSSSKMSFSLHRILYFFYKLITDKRTLFIIASENRFSFGMELCHFKCYRPEKELIFLFFAYFIFSASVCILLTNHNLSIFFCAISQLLRLVCITIRFIDTFIFFNLRKL